MPCDHSDGGRLAVLGRHTFKLSKLERYYTIPIIDVKYPPHQFLTNDNLSHDFAMLVLKEPAKWSQNIHPICLPQQDEEFGGETATAAGWGRTAPKEISEDQSTKLKSVNLIVSDKKYKHTKMFGTELSTQKDEYKDACSGDSGQLFAELSSIRQFISS